MFDPVGPIARELLELWWILLAIGGAAFGVFAVVLALGLRRPRGTVHDPPGHGSRGSTRLLVLGGVVLPAVVVLLSFGFTARTMHVLPEEAPPGALSIEVVGRQWSWEVRYANGASVTNELRIPVGEPVALRLTSADVIHSLWIPRLAGKLDALPDYANTLVVEADEPGRFTGRCAEFCGLAHAEMNLVVVAVLRPEFDRWLEAQGAS